jgi:hypothetical protein
MIQLTEANPSGTNHISVRINLVSNLGYFLRHDCTVDSMKTS